MKEIQRLYETAFQKNRNSRQIIKFKIISIYIYFNGTIHQVVFHINLIKTSRIIEYITLIKSLDKLRST